MNYEIDNDRMEEYKDSSTGIYVRAIHEEKWGSYDILWLKKDSLIEFLRSRGEKSEWAESVVLALLGH